MHSLSKARNSPAALWSLFLKQYDRFKTVYNVLTVSQYVDERGELKYTESNISYMRKMGRAYCHIFSKMEYEAANVGIAVEQRLRMTAAYHEAYCLIMKAIKNTPKPKPEMK